MGEASRRKAQRSELLDQLADDLHRSAPGTLREVLQGLLDRDVQMGQDPAPPDDCAGCRFAREHARRQGMPAALSDLILAELHRRHGAAAEASPPALPLGALPALALTKGLAQTTVGPWRVILLHLEQQFLLTIRMEARSSTPADWEQLGTIAAQLGAPAEPIVPVGQLAPDHALLWRWPAPVVPGGLAADAESRN